MTDTSYDITGVRVLECSAEGPTLRAGRDATDLIGAARGESASLVALPVERLHDDFFRLRTGVAGEFVQKFVTYRVRLAIVGDIARHLSASEALRDFVYECNERNEVWFVRDHAELEAKLRDQG
jgi:hypothetical protein